MLNISEGIMFSEDVMLSEHEEQLLSLLIAKLILSWNPMFWSEAGK